MPAPSWQKTEDEAGVVDESSWKKKKRVLRRTPARAAEKTRRDEAGHHRRSFQWTLRARRSSSQAGRAPYEAIGGVMELLISGLSHGRHVYNPFPKEGVASKSRSSPRPLEDLCYRAIIARCSLRRLKGCDLPMLPPIIRRRLTTLSTQDFVEIECAPFTDIFDSNMYHRALTYRVRCSLDGGEYMAAHANSPLAADFRQWVDMVHANLMCVYALAMDSSNLFLIMDVPEATLKRLEVFLVSQGLCFPEYFLWKVAAQLSSVIGYIEERQLSFGRFDRKNVYVIQDRVLMDNKLTWKSCVDSSSIQNRVQSIVLGDKVSLGGHYELQANSPSKASVMCLGFVLTRLASIALVDRKKQQQPPSSCPTNVIDPGTAPPKMLNDIPVFDGFKPRVPEGALTYSSDLFDLLASLHSTNLPSLAAIHAKAVEMMTRIAGKGRVSTLVFCDDDCDLTEMELDERAC